MSEQTIQPEQDPPAGVEEELRAHAGSLTVERERRITGAQAKTLAKLREVYGVVVVNDIYDDDGGAECISHPDYSCVILPDGRIDATAPLVGPAMGLRSMFPVIDDDYRARAQADIDAEHIQPDADADDLEAAA